MSGAPIAPGLSLTLYDGSTTLRAALRGTRALLEEARPPIVKLHAYPTAALAPTLDELRRVLVGVRVHLGVPGNTLVRDDGPAKASGYARLAASWGVELLELNLEKSSTETGPGWTPDSGTKYSPAELERRAQAVLDAVRPELGAVKLGLTSHDKPRRFRLPWRTLLGPTSPVVLHAPQYYAAPARKKVEPNGPPPMTTWRGAKARADASDADWLALAAAGTIRGDLAPGGAGFSVYAQLHDITVGGVVLLLDRTAASGGWACNASTGEADRRKRPKCDADGARAVRVLQRIRAEVGPAPGAVARWQAARGLEADGIVGPKTLAALGL